jgi:hypothetical protein
MIPAGPVDPVQEKSLLAAQATELKAELAALEERLAALDRQQPETDQ